MEYQVIVVLNPKPGRTSQLGPALHVPYGSHVYYANIYFSQPV